MMKLIILLVTKTRSIIDSLEDPRISKSIFAINFTYPLLNWRCEMKKKLIIKMAEKVVESEG